MYHTHLRNIIRLYITFLNDRICNFLENRNYKNPCDYGKPCRKVDNLLLTPYALHSSYDEATNEALKMYFYRFL